MGFLSKKKEDDSNQTTTPAEAPMAPPDLQVPSSDQSEQPMGEAVPSMDDLPELPPLDLPDLDADSDVSQPEQQEVSDVQEESEEIVDEEPTEDQQIQTGDEPVSPMDNLDIPTDLDATEPVEEEEMDMPETEDVSEPAEEEPVIDEAPVKEEVVEQNPIQSRVMYDTSSPIFIEQQLYVDSLENIYHVKAELVQIQKFANLTQDLEDHIGDKFDSYKNTLLSTQKKVLLMEKKLFEE